MQSKRSSAGLKFGPQSARCVLEVASGQWPNLQLRPNSRTPFLKERSLQGRHCGMVTCSSEDHHSALVALPEAWRGVRFQFHNRHGESMEGGAFTLNCSMRTTRGFVRSLSLWLFLEGRQAANFCRFILWLEFCHCAPRFSNNSLRLPVLEVLGPL